MSSKSLIISAISPKLMVISSRKAAVDELSRRGLKSNGFVEVIHLLFIKMFKYHLAEQNKLVKSLFIELIIA